MKKHLLTPLSCLASKKPKHFLVNGLDLVAIYDEIDISVLYGRCLHRGALLGDGHIQGGNLICGLHGWDYRYDTGISEHSNLASLHKFNAWIEDTNVYIDMSEVENFLIQNPQPFDRQAYQGDYADTHPETSEPYTKYIQELARNGLQKFGYHGPYASMGINRNILPLWENIQFLPAQLHKRPLFDGDQVTTKIKIGEKAKKPLALDLPIIVSDMSFGALSKEAKIALAKGAESAGTGICSGEGGMLPKEQENNSRYFYEYASAKFGFSWEKVMRCQAFHFKCGQGANTGIGGHLPGEKVNKAIAKARGIKEGEPAISPTAFSDLKTVDDFRLFALEVRKKTEGIPIGFKIGASHIEKDIQFALDVGIDYIIIDGRGGGTGIAPTIIRNNINVPTIPALARARKYLDQVNAKHVSLIITGGLRLPEDYAKALMLGADAVAVSNAALQAIGCLGMRACGTNNCPVGIATQKENLRSRLIIDSSAKQLHNFLIAANDLIKVIARSCGYDNVSKFNKADLCTLDFDIHLQTGIPYSGV